MENDGNIVQTKDTFRGVADLDCAYIHLYNFLELDLNLVSSNFDITKREIEGREVNSIKKTMKLSFE